MKNTFFKYLLISFVFSFSNLTAQKSDFIVVNTNDTIYVDKIKMKYGKIIVKKEKKKNKYHFDEILSFYDSKENQHYERVISPFIEKIGISHSDSDRYDYRKREMSFLKENENDNLNKYTFLNRLTKGKVKLFSSTVTESGGLMTPSNPFPTPGYSNTSFFIAIYDSKLESIDSNSDLKLDKDVYNILKIYLYGNNEIKKRLEGLYLSKPKAKKEQVIDLINDYNKSIESIK